MTNPTIVKLANHKFVFTIWDLVIGVAWITSIVNPNRC